MKIPRINRLSCSNFIQITTMEADLYCERKLFIINRAGKIKTKRLTKKTLSKTPNSLSAMNKTKVYFCVEENDQLLAVFTSISEGPKRFLCYSHVGQHSVCCLDYVKGKTKPTKEFETLKKELERLSYKVQPVDLTEFLEQQSDYRKKWCSCEMPAKIKGQNLCWRCKLPFNPLS